jgi:hypothetical protein
MALLLLPAGRAGPPSSCLAQSPARQGTAVDHTVLQASRSWPKHKWASDAFCADCRTLWRSAQVAVLSGSNQQSAAPAPPLGYTTPEGAQAQMRNVLHAYHKLLTVGLAGCTCAGLSMPVSAGQFLTLVWACDWCWQFQGICWIEAKLHALLPAGERLDRTARDPEIAHSSCPEHEPVSTY